MKAKRTVIICLVVAALLVAAQAFAGGETEAASSDGLRTLTFTTNSNYGGTMVDPSNDLLVYQEYEKLTGIRIEWEVIPRENYEAIMNARLAARNDISDILRVAGNRAMDLGADGILVPLEDMIDKVGVNLQKFWGREDKRIYRVMATASDGHIWGIPNYVLPSYLTLGVLLPKPWLDRLGIETPRTIDEYFDMLIAFRDKDANGNGDPNDEIPLVPAYASYERFIANWFGMTDFAISSAGGYYLDDSGKVNSHYIDPRYKEYLTFMNKLWNENLLDKEYLSSNFNITYEKVSADIAGAIICWCTFSGTFSGLHPEGDKSGETPIFIPQIPPVGPYGQAKFPYRYLAGIGGNAVTSFSKYPEDAMRWIDIVYASDEALKLQNWGIEGITYTLENGEFKPMDNPDGTWSDLLASVGGGQPTFAHVQWGWDTRFPKWAVEINKTMQPYFVPPLPIVSQTVEENDVEKEVGADLNTYRDEMRNKFIQGQVPLSEFDNYVATMKRLGIDRLIQNKQQQHDRAVEILKEMGF